MKSEIFEDRTSLNLMFMLAALALFSSSASGALISGQTVGIDFGATAPSDPSNTWNVISVGGDANTPGLADAGTVVLGNLNSTDGAATGSTFTFQNNSGQIAFDFTVDSNVGNGSFINHASVLDAIISNDASGAGRVVEAGTDTFLFTFSGLDDSLTYTLEGGYDRVITNNGFDAVWSADGQSFATGSNGSDGDGYGALTGLRTDGSGNLAISVTGTAAGASHITVSALTLTAVAVPEPNSVLAGGLAALVGVFTRRRRKLK